MDKKTFYESETKKLAKVFGNPKFIKSVSLTCMVPFIPVWDQKRLGEVAFVLERNNGNIWIIKKSHYPKNFYRIPTGGIEIGETVSEALFRELEEETSLKLNPTDFLGVIKYKITTTKGERENFATFIFKFFPLENEPTPKDMSENISEHRWVSPLELRRLGEKMNKLKFENDLELGGRQDWAKFRAVLYNEVANLTNH